MGDIYRYPVYFNCGKVLSKKQRGRITNYFQIKRRSDGGECSPVEEVSENIYRIAFRHREDQQSVLQRREHVLQLREGSLTFNVKENLDPQTSGHTSSSTSSSSSSTTCPARTPQVIPPSPPPPSGEDYELHPDGSLRESLQASACSAPFDPAEQVSVKSPAVEEVNSLLESFSSHQARDEFSQVNSTVEEVEGRSSLRDSLASGNRTLTTNSPSSGAEIQMEAAAQIPAGRTTRGGGVHVEIIQGTIETQQADALVSPMIGYDPQTSTIGNTLHQRVGPQLTAAFKAAAGSEVMVGVPVLVENLPGQRTSSRPLAVRIVMHPDDHVSSQVFKSAQEEIDQNQVQGSIILQEETRMDPSKLAAVQEWPQLGVPWVR